MRICDLTLAVILACWATSTFAEDQFVERLQRAVEAKPAEPKITTNGLVEIWARYLKPYLSKSGSDTVVIVTPGVATTNGHSSVLIVAPNDLADTEAVALLMPMLERRLGEPPPAPRVCAGTADPQRCCDSSPALDCVASYDPSGGLLPDLGAVKLLTTAADLLASEISASTDVLTERDLTEHRLSGDEVYYVWRHRPRKIAGDFLMTRLSTELLDTVATTLRVAVPHVRSVLGQDGHQDPAYDCRADGTQTTNWTGSSAPTFRLSRGHAVTVRSGSRAYYSTLFVRPSADGLLLRMTGDKSNASDEWKSMHAALVTETKALGRCLGVEAAQIKKGLPADVVLFLFYSIYIHGVSSEVESISAP